MVKAEEHMRFAVQARDRWSAGPAPRTYAPQSYAPQSQAPRSQAPRSHAPQSHAPHIYAPRGFAPTPVAAESFAPKPRAAKRARRADGGKGLPWVIASCLGFVAAGIVAQGVFFADTEALAKGDALVRRSDLRVGTAPVKGDRLVAIPGQDAVGAIEPVLSFNERFSALSDDPSRRAVDAAPATRNVASGAKTKTEAKSEALPPPYKVASLTMRPPVETKPRIDLPLARESETRLIPFENSAFPYYGKNPRTNAPFLNVSDDGRRGRRGAGGRVYWHDETYADNRVLVHVPKTFDARKPGVIVLFFHGNGATLERDVRDRQRVPQQISESGANAVLLAPQLAVDAADSSAGKFWQPGALKRFLLESSAHLARLYGDPAAAKTFASMPVVIVAYSGGYVPAAWALHVGGLDGRVRGVVLLDALYGELDKFASWIEKNPSGVFVSAYTRYTRRRDDQLVNILSEKGIEVGRGMSRSLRPGTVAFVATRDGITHRDYVTNAWTGNPIKDVLARMSEFRS